MRHNASSYGCNALLDTFVDFWTKFCVSQVSEDVATDHLDDDWCFILMEKEKHLKKEIFDISCLQVFNYIITTVIVVNIIVLASTAYGESTKFTNAKEDCNYMFTAIFITEAAIKITGLGWGNYWRSGWNKFDFFLILMAIVDIGFTAIASHGSSVSHCTPSCKLCFCFCVIMVHCGLLYVQKMRSDSSIITRLQSALLKSTLRLLCCMMD